MSTRMGHVVKGSLIWILILVYLTPVFWMVLTSLKAPVDTFTVPPKLIPWVDFQPTSDGYVRVLFQAKAVTGGLAESMRSDFPRLMVNSFIVALVSTALAVALGTLAAYGFSRFRIRGGNDLLFYILSTRFLPPLAVVLPLYTMFQVLGLLDTLEALIITYFMFNISYAVWIMKGFIDEIPGEFEEAAMVDGYSRMRAAIKVIFPQVVPAMLVTAFFCIITAWNEFGFAVILTSHKAQTAPISIAISMGQGLTDWGAMSAGSLVFALPVFVLTFIFRRYLLRGMTFGAVRG